MARKVRRAERGAFIAHKLRCFGFVLALTNGGCTELASNSGKLLLGQVDGGGDSSGGAGGRAQAGPDGAADADSGRSDEPDVASLPDSSGGEAAAPEACVSDCPEGGVFRCSTGGDAGGSTVQICANENGCLVWRDLGACPADHLCCGGVCVSADESNCYACGTRCDEPSPICDKETQKCGCDDRSCPAGRVCDKALARCAEETAPAGYDFYVSATAQPGGDGSAKSPFRTITEALVAATPQADAGTNDAGDAGMSSGASDAADAGDSSAYPVRLEHESGPSGGDAEAGTDESVFIKRIHVEPGTYDEDLGEKFPLRIPGGIALDGAGPERTFIEGLAYVDPGGTGSSNWITLFVGDPVRTSRVSGFTLRPGKGAPARTFIGIECRKGNAGKPDADPPVPPNTFVSNVVIGPRYWRGIEVSTSESPDCGCNLRVTASTITDDENGVIGAGCAQYPKYAPVRVELEGNTFKNLVNTDGFGNAIRFGGCTRLVAKNNSFVQSDTGMTLYGTYQADTGFSLFTLQNNVFDSIGREGLSAQGGAIVFDDFSGNTFTNITSEHVLPDSLYAIAMHLSSGGGEPAFPVVQRGRNNRFIGNDQGLKIEAYSYPVGFPGSDFGNKDEPGNNVFRCNGGRAGVTGVTADVMFALYDLSSQVSFPFEGNEWDHVPPTQLNFTSNPDTAFGDVLFLDNVVVDLAGARTSPLDCPRGIVP